MRGPRAAATVALAGALTVAAGCEERHQVTHGVWNLFAIREAREAGKNVAMSATFPDGFAADEFLQAQDDGTFTLRVHPCFAEGAPAAYVTTEVWVNYYDAIWLEPAYGQYIDNSRPPNPLKYTDGRRAPWIIDVGPESAFYSPFWQLNWAMVGNAAPERYRTSTELFNAHVPIVPASTTTAPLKPADVVPTRPGGAHVLDPTFGIELEDTPTRETWYAGEEEIEKLEMFDFGSNLFTVENEGHGGIVEALPIFVFVTRDGAGNPEPLPGALNVAGVSPVGSGRAADVAHDPATGRPQPHFGGLWQIHFAYVSQSAGAFHADGYPASATAVSAAGGDPRDYEGRVARDATCFMNAAQFPAGCQWLDSQAKLETSLGSAAFVATDLTATCPFVLYEKQPVKR